jgi:hypothetical protein
MRLFEGDVGEPVPTGASRIYLDGRLSSDLNWKKGCQQALTELEQGRKIFWELDLGLFHELPQPLTSQTQFASLSATLDHFRSTLWQEFAASTVGLCLYRGTVDFRQVEERDRFVGYLDLLAVNMPDALPLYLLLDATSLEPWETIILLNREAFSRWHCLIRADGIPFSLYQNESPLALLLPSGEKSQAPLLKEAINALLAQGISFRIIPESLLITEWDRLDHLIVLSEAIDSQGLRKLQGFCAAGGCIITLGESLGTPIEIGFDPFLRGEQ